MFLLTDGEELSDALVGKDPFAPVDVAIAEEVVDKDGVELLDCDPTTVDSFEDTDTFWATLTVALCDAGFDWLAETGPLVLTGTPADSLVEGGLGLALTESVGPKAEENTEYVRAKARDDKHILYNYFIIALKSM